MISFPSYQTSKESYESVLHTFWILVVGDLVDVKSREHFDAQVSYVLLLLLHCLQVALGFDVTATTKVMTHVITVWWLMKEKVKG